MPYSYRLWDQLLMRNSMHLKNSSQEIQQQLVRLLSRELVSLQLLKFDFIKRKIINKGICCYHLMIENLAVSSSIYFWPYLWQWQLQNIVYSLVVLTMWSMAHISHFYYEDTNQFHSYIHFIIFFKSFREPIISKSSLKSVSLLSVASFTYSLLIMTEILKIKFWAHHSEIFFNIFNLKYSVVAT